MSDRKLSLLLEQQKISLLEYKIYLLFTGNDIGREVLKAMLMAIVMEEPMQPTDTLFAWHDGRRSTWRDIQRMIDSVNNHLENS